ncbi:MAG TPA: hypothetical protein VHD36_24225 [Pirellulales bacterium]|nr:hypothetical protein [Pirellulales bacterium]
MGRYFRNSGLAAFLLATILAGGAMVAWGIFAGFTGVSVVTSWAGGQAREMLQITALGRPVIWLWKSGQNATNEYLSLDRKVIPSGELTHKKSGGIKFIQPRTLAADLTAERTNNFYDWIRGYTNGSVPQKYWYLVREGEALERAYFVGYDSQTSAFVGFLGTGGFRIDQPPPAEQFDLGARSLTGTTATLWAGPYRGMTPNYVGPRDGGGRVAILSVDQLYLLDLASQTVRHVPLAEPVLSIDMTNESEEVDDDVEQEMRVLVRTREHLLLLDWQGETVRTIALPEALIGRDIKIYLPLGPEIVLEQWRGTDVGPPYTHELYWLDAESHVTRRESITLAEGQNMDVPVLRVAICAVPSPAVLAAFGYLLTGAANKDVDLTKVRWRVWNISWRLYSLLCLISAALAVLAFRRQRRYEPRTAPAWAVFVFLLGPAGLLGYLAHRRWPALDDCAACGARVPRNRENCRSCQAEFPAPALLGGEVFA